MQAETSCPMKIFIFTLLSCIFRNAYLVSYPTQYCSTLTDPYTGRIIQCQQKTEAFLKLPYMLGLWVHFPVMKETWKFLEIGKHPLPSVAGDAGEATAPFLWELLLSDPLLFGPDLSHISHHAWPVPGSPWGCGCPSASGIIWLPDPTITHLETSQHSWNRSLWCPDRSLGFFVCIVQETVVGIFFLSFINYFNMLSDAYMDDDIKFLNFDYNIFLLEMLSYHPQLPCFSTGIPVLIASMLVFIEDPDLFLKHLKLPIINFSQPWSSYDIQFPFWSFNCLKTFS